MCKYIYGEIFNLIPFASLVGDFINIFKEIYKNPWTAIGLVMGILCNGLCSIDYNIAYAVCIVPKTLAKIGDAVITVQNILDEGYWDIPDAFCEQAMDILGDQEKAEKRARQREQQEESEAQKKAEQERAAQEAATEAVQQAEA